MRKTAKNKYFKLIQQAGKISAYLAIFVLSVQAGLLGNIALGASQTENTDISENEKQESLVLSSVHNPQSDIQEFLDEYEGLIIQQVSLLQISSVEMPDSSKDKTRYFYAGPGVIVTAYSSTPDQTDSSPFITANGTYVHDGIIACNFLPFGTKVRFPEFSGDKVYSVEDRMAKRNSHKMDIWMPNRYQALQFGVQYLRYEVVK